MEVACSSSAAKCWGRELESSGTEPSVDALIPGWSAVSTVRRGVSDGINWTMGDVSISYCDGFV